MSAMVVFGGSDRRGGDVGHAVKMHARLLAPSIICPSPETTAHLYWLVLSNPIISTTV